MPRDARKYLFDVRRAAGHVLEFTSGKSQNDYLQNALLRSAVERQFEIMGEALGQLAKLDQALASEITDVQKIISFRNVLIHGYADVDDELVWDIVETRVSGLLREVEKLLSEATG